MGEKRELTRKERKTNNHPRVIVAIVVKKNGKVLLGKRKKHPVAWGLVGGRLKFGENIRSCALRELEEEVDIKVKNLELENVSNDIFTDIGKHFVTIIMTADYKSGDVTLKEPDNCERWEWFKWDKLPKPLASPLKNMLRRVSNPFDAEVVTSPY